MSQSIGTQWRSRFLARKLLMFLTGDLIGIAWAVVAYSAIKPIVAWYRLLKWCRIMPSNT